MSHFLEFSQQKSSNIKFHENYFGGKRVVSCGKTDTTKLTVTFRCFANALKNYSFTTEDIADRLEIVNGLSKWDQR